MLDYTKKIKELKNEIEVFELEKIKIDVLIRQYIEDNGIKVCRDGRLSKFNDEETKLYVGKLREQKQLLTSKIYIRREQINQLKELIRLSLVDSECIYNPDYFYDVIESNGFIGAIKF